MRQLSPGAKPAGAAHAARRDLSAQRWSRRSGASRRATLAYASCGDADGLRETHVKKLVWFERSAHDIVNEEPGKVLLSLVQFARPIAERAGDVASMSTLR